MENVIVYNLYKESKKSNHNYSWVYIKLPLDIQKSISEFAKQIELDDINEEEGGLESLPHVTVKYAIETTDVKDIKEILKGLKGGKVYLGKSTIFENDGFDVVKIEVESDALNNIHNELNKLPHEDKYPKYSAHATIAYVKKGEGKKYVNRFKLNKSFKIKEVYFGNLKKDFKISLSSVEDTFNWYKTACTE